MALIKCRECGSSVSTEAASCPHCGAPQSGSGPPRPPATPVNAPPTLERGQASTDETIYSGNNVSVTTTRVIIHGTTYALRNITSVKRAFTPEKTGCAIVLLVIGVIS